MATAGRDGSLRLWDLELGTEVMTIKAAGQPISSLAFSADGEMLAAVDNDILRVYTLNVATLSEIGRSRVSRTFTDAECRQFFANGECPA